MCVYISDGLYTCKRRARENVTRARYVHLYIQQYNSSVVPGNYTKVTQYRGDDYLEN